MTDSLLSCGDCGSNLSENPFEPCVCGPCYESDAQAGLRSICGLCQGNGDLREQLYFRDGRVVEVRRVCHACGGEGELTFPRWRVN